MPSRLRKPINRVGRPAYRIPPDLLSLEPRLVPTYTFPGIGGIALDASGDLFVSHDSTTSLSGQRQAVAELDPNGRLISAGVFGTAGASALPGQMATVGSSALLPFAAAGDILELQPNGQLFDFKPVTRAYSQVDNLANDPRRPRSPGPRPRPSPRGHRSAPPSSMRRPPTMGRPSRAHSAIRRRPGRCSPPGADRR